MQARATAAATDIRTRRGLPDALPDEVARPRLVDRLASRWRVPLVLLEAPGGYGKSTALAQAIRDNLEDPSGVDLYLPCREADRESSELLRGLLVLLDGDFFPEDNDAELARRIVDELSHRAPTDLCIVLDDEHVMSDDDSAVAALGALIRELPVNAHVILAGRRIPALALARLRAADHLISIGADELTFTQAETDALATNHSADGALLVTTGGWPAVTRLALATGHEQSLDYPWKKSSAISTTHSASVWRQLCSRTRSTTRCSCIWAWS